MLSIEQLTIVAYMTDGGILCRKCGEAERLPMKDALCAYSAGEYAGNEGLYCDNCSYEIDPPYEWTCPDCETGYVGEDAVSSEESHDEGNGCGATDCTGIARQGGQNFCDNCEGGPRIIKATTVLGNTFEFCSERCRDMYAEMYHKTYAN